MRVLRCLPFALLGSLPLACSSSNENPPPPADAGGDVVASDAGGDAASPLPCNGPCPASKVKYLVLLVLENQTFDVHFGNYCTAVPGSNPSCTDGPSCCEAAPKMEPSGASPVNIDEQLHGSYDPNHKSDCEVAEIDNGAMDKFVAGATCSNAKNFGLIASDLAKPYWDLAKTGALADHWFQPIVGESSSNNMYFARAGFVFLDNTEPDGAVGTSCQFVTKREAAHTEKTIADLLGGAGVGLGVYAEGYKAQADAFAASGCADADPACPSGLQTYPCTFDPGDIPFEYYDATRDKPSVIKDYASFASDLSAKTLPAVSFVKPLGFKTEHPGNSSKLADAATFVQDVLGKVQGSAYANDTLVLLAWDEGGGYFDHVKPPDANPADGQAYGTRVPMLALGPFAKKNSISHVVMEHSSIVKFIEWNWLGKQTGQLGTRDANVNNIGSLLDPAATGETVP